MDLKSGINRDSGGKLWNYVTLAAGTWPGLGGVESLVFCRQELFNCHISCPIKSGLEKLQSGETVGRDEVQPQINTSNKPQ